MPPVSALLPWRHIPWRRPKSASKKLVVVAASVSAGIRNHSLTLAANGELLHIRQQHTWLLERPLRIPADKRFSRMKAPVALGIGFAGGAILASALLLVLTPHQQPAKQALSPSPDRVARESEIAALRQELREAQESAQRERDALRAALQDIQAALRQGAQPKSSPAVAPAPTKTGPAGDAAFTSYLGTPVPAPANLDRKYSPGELEAVFRDLTETLGIKVEKLAVDTTEFPFVIHGRIQSAAGAGFFKKIDSELRALPGYTYGGSVTGGTRDGSTYFALNMIPSSAYPPEHAETIGRRMMLRLQMTAAASRDAQP